MHLRIAQINAENLFIFLDKMDQNASLRLIETINQRSPDNTSEKNNERIWQSLSSASVTNKPLKKTIGLARALLDIDADIILLNEVGGKESLDNFNQYFLNHRYESWLIEGNSDRGIDVGFLTRKNLGLTATIASNKSYPLDLVYPHEIGSEVTKQYYFSRDCAELLLFQSDSKKPCLLFLLVHLKSKLDPDGIDPQGRNRRASEVRALVEIYRNRRQELGPMVPIIVGGDFNGNVRRESPDAEFSSLLQDTDLQNAFEVFGMSIAESFTQLQFPRGSDPIPLQIDYIFVPKNLVGSLVQEDTYVYRYKSDLGVPPNQVLPQVRTFDQRAALPSDHYPIVSAIKLIF